MVKVVRDEKGRFQLHFSSEEGRRAWEEEGDPADAGVELLVLNTNPGEFGRNYYSGQGYSRVQIPLNAYFKLEQNLNSRKGSGEDGGDLDRDALLSLALMGYLNFPFYRRKTESNGKWVIPRQPLSTNSASSNSGEEEAVSVVAISGSGKEDWTEDPDLVGQLSLSLSAGPVWYAEPEWLGQIGEEFAEHFEATGYFNSLSKDEFLIALRDAMTPLKLGVPILSDFLAVLASERLAYDLVRNLESYVNPDIYGPLFNGHTNRDISSRLVIFDVKGVTDEMRPLRMMQAMELVWRKVTCKPSGSKERTLLGVDEFGVVANQSPDTAQWAALFYKRIRAFGGSMCVLDQDTTSLRGQVGRYIKSNTSIYFIMRQDREDAAYWVQMFRLTEEDVEAIVGFGPGEALVLIEEGNRTQKFRVKVSMSEDVLNMLSTRPDDVLRYVEAQRAQQGTKDDPILSRMEEIFGHSFARR
jgi:hypothetical protein